MKYAIYSRATDSYGISVIIENIIAAFGRKGIDCRQITSLNDSLNKEIILPYGLLETVEMIESGRCPNVSLLIDAISLGARNKFVNYTKVGHCLHSDYISSLAKYIKWHYLERQVVSKVKNIVLVSEQDGIYLQKINPSVNIIICRNGVSLVTNSCKTESNKFRLGLLSSWMSRQSYEENNWFIRKYYNRYANKNNNVELVIAGRGVYANKFKDSPYIKVMGEIENLDVFFKNIDVFVAANLKGCGILNRCLDAFAYGVPVIGFKDSFSGFGYMKDSFISFVDYKEFEDVSERIRRDISLGRLISINATSYISQYNNWQHNYDKLIEEIIKLS